MSNAYSQDLKFEIKKLDGEFLIEEQSSREIIYLEMETPDIPKIEKIEKNGDLQLVYYFAGNAGTSRLVYHEKLVIFDIKKNKFHEKTYTTKLEGLRKEAQPTFKIKNGKIEYHLPIN